MAAFFSKQEMADLLVTAWEGGSNYWVEVAEYIMPPGMSKKDLRKAAWEAATEGERQTWKDQGPEGRWPLYALLPFLPPSVKWKISLKPNDDEPVFLTPENMREAGAKVAKAYPKIFARIKEGQFDSLDADVWLQLAVFDEVIYG